MSSPSNRWLHRYAVMTAVATLGLIVMGGLVTSHGVGMAVPDWPTSYGYNMFALPFSIWLTGGVFHEHTHRQWASIVGILVVFLTRWLGGAKSRKPILIVGGIEFVAGLLMFKLGPEWRGAGGFLSGIGGVVLLAGIVWVKNEPATKPLPTLGWWTFGLVQLQGLLGGLRVVLDAHEFAGVKLGVIFGIFHACLAQGFFVLLCAIALLTSRAWNAGEHSIFNIPHSTPNQVGRSGWLKFAVLATTLLIFLQLIVGATMRHQHAGLAIWDFPLAHGKLWPATDPESIQHYNEQRIEVAAANPITAFQVQLQMVHRLMAVLIFFAVSICAWRTIRESGRENVLSKLALLWFGLILIQIGLGAWTVLSHKAADIATAHVLVGVLSLATGAMLCIFNFRSHDSIERATAFSSDASNASSLVTGSAQ